MPATQFGEEERVAVCSIRASRSSDTHLDILAQKFGKAEHVLSKAAPADGTTSNTAAPQLSCVLICCESRSSVSAAGGSRLCVVQRAAAFWFVSISK